MMCLPAQAQDRAQIDKVRRELTEEDRKIYLVTFDQCQPGTTRSAFQLAFEPSNFLLGFENWIVAGSGNVDAIQERARSGMLDPSIARLRHSQGFWLALADCYGYRYGELGYGNLMKQIVDMGHHANQIGSFAAAAGVTVGGGKFATMALKKFPVASRFFISGLVSLHIANLVNQLRALYFQPATAESEARLAAAKEQVFSEPDKAIANVWLVAEQAIQQLDGKLIDPTIPQSEKILLAAKRERIAAGLERLRSLRSNL